MNPYLSSDSSVSIAIHDQVLLISCYGPIDTEKATELLITSAPFVEHLAQTNEPWGTIIQIERDSTFFKEAIQQLVNNTIKNSHLYVNRRRMAFVVSDQVFGLVRDKVKPQSLFGVKTSHQVSLFDNIPDAMKWVREPESSLT